AGTHGQDSAGPGETAKPAPMSDGEPTPEKVTNKVSRVGVRCKWRPPSRAGRVAAGRGRRGGAPPPAFLWGVTFPPHRAPPGSPACICLRLYFTRLAGPSVPSGPCCLYSYSMTAKFKLTWLSGSEGA